MIKLNNKGGDEMKREIVLENKLRKEFRELLKRLKDYVEPNSKENFKILLDDVIHKLSFEIIDNIINGGKVK